MEPEPVKVRLVAPAITPLMELEALLDMIERAVKPETVELIVTLPTPDEIESAGVFVSVEPPTIKRTMATPLPPAPPTTLQPLFAHAPPPEVVEASLAEPAPPPPPVLATPLPPTVALASFPEADAPPPPAPPTTAAICAELKNTPPPPPPP